MSCSDPIHSARVTNGSEIHKRWNVRLLFIAKMFLYVRGSFHHGDDQFSDSDQCRGRHQLFMIFPPYYVTSCSQFTNGARAVKKLIASSFMETICSLKTLSENYCWHQTIVCQGRVIIEVPQYHPLSLKNELQRSPKSCKMTSERSVCGTSHSSQAYMQPTYIYHKELYTIDNKFNLKSSVSRCTLPIFFS